MGFNLGVDVGTGEAWNSFFASLALREPSGYEEAL
jgi:hypothetical protein